MNVLSQDAESPGREVSICFHYCVNWWPRWVLWNPGGFTPSTPVKGQNRIRIHVPLLGIKGINMPFSFYCTLSLEQMEPFSLHGLQLHPRIRFFPQEFLWCSHFIVPSRSPVYHWAGQKTVSFPTTSALWGCKRSWEGMTPGNSHYCWSLWTFVFLERRLSWEYNLSSLFSKAKHTP